MHTPSTMDVDFDSDNTVTKAESRGRNKNFQNWIFGFVFVILPLVIIAFLKSQTSEQSGLCAIGVFFDSFFSDYEILYICVTLILPAMFEMYTTQSSGRGKAMLFNFLSLDLVSCCFLYGILKWNAELESAPNISVNLINVIVICVTFFLGRAAFIKGKE